MANDQRLIYANAVMKEIERCFAPPKTLITVYEALSSIIKEAPTVDAVKVVRCKVCKSFRVWEDGSKTCTFWSDQWDMPTTEDAFCSYGERRNDERLAI